MRKGYAFLITVLAIGTIAAATASSLLLLGVGAGQTALTTQQSTQAQQYAIGCSERALLSLLEENTYPGNETIDFTYGSCTILPVGGAGNENRTICTEAESGNSIRRYEVVVERLLPSPSLYSWQEVTAFTLCSY